jgi:hypothetical protein
VVCAGGRCLVAALFVLVVLPLTGRRDGTRRCRVRRTRDLSVALGVGCPCPIVGRIVGRGTGLPYVGVEWMS